MAEGYRRMPLTGELLDLALQRARLLPVFENSHRKLQANYVGCIGEVVFERFLDYHGISFRDDTSSTERDYVIGRQLTVDVKTKDRTVRPRRDYENSVPLYNHEHQQPDYYYFISLLRDAGVDEQDPSRFKTAFLVGGIDQQGLRERAVHWREGQVDPSNGTRFWTACLNVQMSALTSNAELLEVFRAA